MDSFTTPSKQASETLCAKEEWKDAWSPVMEASGRARLGRDYSRDERLFVAGLTDASPVAELKELVGFLSWLGLCGIEEERGRRRP